MVGRGGGRGERRSGRSAGRRDRGQCLAAPARGRSWLRAPPWLTWGRAQAARGAAVCGGDPGESQTIPTSRAWWSRSRSSRSRSSRVAGVERVEVALGADLVRKVDLCARSAARRSSCADTARSLLAHSAHHHRPLSPTASKAAVCRRCLRYCRNPSPAPQVQGRCSRMPCFAARSTRCAAAASA